MDTIAKKIALRFKYKSTLESNNLMDRVAKSVDAGNDYVVYTFKDNSSCYIDYGTRIHLIGEIESDN